MDRSTYLKEKECDLFSFAEIFAVSIINAIVLRSGIQPVCKVVGLGVGVGVSLELKWPGREGNLLLLDPYSNSPAASLSS